MGLIFTIILISAFIVAPNVLFMIIKNFPKVIYYGVKDIYSYVKEKRWRLCNVLGIHSFDGIFGTGKTLSCAHRARMIYHAYDGLRVFCPRQRKWVTQKINIVSNFEFKTIPFVPLESLQQVVDLSVSMKKFDDEHGTRTVTVVAIDEAGSELNSRDFKKNIDPYTLNAIVTCRHNNICIFWMCQRFHMADKLMRDVTSNVYSCKKIWRFEFLRVFDGWELENATNPDLLPCKRVDSFFITDDDYNAYDTYATVEKLKKNAEEGRMLSEDEILAHQSVMPSSYTDELNKAIKHSRRKRYLF